MNETFVGNRNEIKAIFNVPDIIRRPIIYIVAPVL